jgi:alanine-synthesizing transaminase
MRTTPVHPGFHLAQVRYEIRGALARHARALEAAGHAVLKLNIGNPGRFGFRAPAHLTAAITEHLADSDAYCHEQGLESAREAILAQQRGRGAPVEAIERIFIGNGVSELIDLVLRALLATDDEVLVPSPDYPLWTAAVNLNRGRAVHYPCRPENAFVPDPAEIEALVNPRTRAIVVINPNNPTGAVYPREVLEAIAALAERHRLVVLADEIYDQMTYERATFVPMATLVHHALCATMNGLSKVYRACGYRVGWASFSGNIEHSREFLNALELLSSLRLCSNVPGQWAVQTALGGYQSIRELVSTGGRLHESRRAIVEAVARSRFLELTPPMGALYAFIGVRSDRLPTFDDQQFALDLLEHKHVLVAPGSSFNVPYRNYFRITNLPEPRLLTEVFARIEALLESYAAGERPAARQGPDLRLVDRLC